MTYISAELLTFLAAFLGGFLSFTGVFISQARQRSRERRNWHERLLFEGYDLVQRKCWQVNGDIAVMEQRVEFFQLTELDEQKLSETIERHILRLQDSLARDLTDLQAVMTSYVERCLLSRHYVGDDLIDRAIDLQRYTQTFVSTATVHIRMLHARREIAVLREHFADDIANTRGMARELLELARAQIWKQNSFEPRQFYVMNQTHTLTATGIHALDSPNAREYSTSLHVADAE